MSRCLYVAKVLLLGLLTAQIIATIQVYLSNAGLYHSLISIRNAGYLIIPNQRIMQGLMELSPAFFGAIFFTLSLGAGLSLLTLAAAWIWARLFSRKKILLLLFLIPWVGLLVGVNLKGFCPMVTSYFFLIPIMVFVSALRWLPPRRGQRVWLKEIVHLIPLIVLTVLWMSQADSNLFVGLRDNLLLSNNFGMKINDFYYKYTLYPAEVFKSLDQKTLKTCRLEHINKKTNAGLLKKKLINHDYLEINGSAAVDLTIVEQDNILIYKNKGKSILETPFKDFVSRPGNVLREFSVRTDRHGLFRHFTFFSLLIGFPVTLYIVFYTLFCLISCAFVDTRISPVISGILCVLVGIALLVFFHMGAGAKVEEKDLHEAMVSARWQDRVAALKLIQQKGLNIGNYNAYRNMLASPHIPERYWLARVLGASRKPDTYKDLLVFLDDLYPNVVCMAFHSLGQRGKKGIVREIVKRIETSDHWYEQWYAYRTLRTLGWKQAKSQ
ncbi:MAG: hypothetical protein B1H12_07260 [Desulfobacteraceae bacterium 4484_190.2]|nr:MAG: hypothetical protein B1H12_07260 [Desulfobacteraceae bacterium 4484_190.2]